MLLPLISSRVTLRRAGHRHAGPCPKCGGSDSSDKFSLYHDDTFHCFSCGWHGDVITWLREIEGQSCAEAHVTAGRSCSKTDCSCFDKCRNGQGRTQNTRRPLTVPAEDKRKDFSPADPQDPAVAWREKASALIAYAHEQLLGDKTQLAFLAARGIDRGAVERYRIGWIDRDFYRSRQSWGLPNEISLKTGQPKKLWIPAGIVIPFFDKTGHPFRIRIRRPLVEAGAPRYYWLPGSGNDVPVLHPERRAFVVVESDLDAIACAAAFDQVGAVPLGTCSAKPKTFAAETLRQALVILVALDGDQAGARAASWWSENYARAVRWPVPVGKDPGDYVKDHQGDLAAWLAAGLKVSCPALSIEAPIKVAVMASDQEQKPEHAYGTSGNGYPYVVAMRGSDVAALQAIYPGTPVFSPSEIRALKGMDQEDAEKVLLIKREFNGIVKFTESVATHRRRR